MHIENAMTTTSTYTKFVLNVDMHIENVMTTTSTYTKFVLNVE